jgi:four helix bundle protein
MTERKSMEFGFERLEVWQRAVSYYTQVCELEKAFPRNEMFGQVSQLKSSALSISLNIAEGSGRQYKKEFKQFLGIARGSVFETVTNLYTARQRGLIGEEDFTRLYNEGAVIAKMLSSLMNRAG